MAGAGYFADAYDDPPVPACPRPVPALRGRIDDYDPIPTEREPEWLDEDQLRDATRKALTRIENLRVD